jgi:hypothetical protein
MSCSSAWISAFQAPSWWCGSMGAQTQIDQLPKSRERHRRGRHNLQLQPHTSSATRSLLQSLGPFHAPLRILKTCARHPDLNLRCKLPHRTFGANFESRLMAWPHPTSPPGSPRRLRFNSPRLRSGLAAAPLLQSGSRGDPGLLLRGS